MASDWFDRVTVAVGVIMLNIMLVVGLLQVVNRYIDLPVSLPWTYEVARTTLAFLAILGIPYLFKNDSDISFLPVLRRITSRTDQLLLVRNVLMAFLSALLVWSAYVATGTSGDTGLPLLSWFKVGWGYTFFGVAAAVLFVVVVTDTKQRVGNLIGGNDV
ncbi:TRAP transporter small permease [Halobellus captivus]|uniref:TRAP transporter small permease n=1 Tax=Halobellus captivus TaxID=2592614 RepID=UPI0011A3F6F0|nr:TRAP transporter small permease subunit [Halobellus captivus]